MEKDSSQQGADATDADAQMSDDWDHEKWVAEAEQAVHYARKPSKRASHAGGRQGSSVTEWPAKSSKQPSSHGVEEAKPRPRRSRSRSVRRSGSWAEAADDARQEGQGEAEGQERGSSLRRSSRRQQSATGLQSPGLEQQPSGRPKGDGELAFPAARRKRQSSKYLDVSEEGPMQHSGEHGPGEERGFTQARRRRQSSRIVSPPEVTVEQRAIQQGRQWGMVEGLEDEPTFETARQRRRSMSLVTPGEALDTPASPGHRTRRQNSQAARANSISERTSPGTPDRSGSRSRVTDDHEKLAMRASGDPLAATSEGGGSRPTPKGRSKRSNTRHSSKVIAIDHPDDEWLEEERGERVSGSPVSKPSRRRLQQEEGNDEMALEYL